jgi:hypothetical protein
MSIHDETRCILFKEETDFIAIDGLQIDLIYSIIDLV